MLVYQRVPLWKMMEWKSVGMIFCGMMTFHLIPTFHFCYSHNITDYIPIKYMESHNIPWGTQWFQSGSSLVPATTQSWRLSARWLMNRPGPYRGASWFHWNSWSLHLPPVRTGHMVFLTSDSTHVALNKSHFWNGKNEAKMMESE